MLTPEDILLKIHKIEKKLGRINLIRWGPRTIDIDILFYNNEIIKKPDLEIPHSELTNRNFVLIPLQEIIPDFVHPVLNKTINDLLLESEDSGKVWKYKHNDESTRITI
jgi:7,8-dihydro-6-hydroxymethylpterin-pyrophosphokinase